MAITATVVDVIVIAIFGGIELSAKNKKIADNIEETGRNCAARFFLLIALFLNNNLGLVINQEKSYLSYL